VPIPDFDDERLDNQQNDRFETYLKQFRPLAVEPLPLEKHGRAARRRFVFAATAAAVILVAAVLAMYSRNDRLNSSDGPGNLASGEQLRDSQPLTIGSANALLANAPSVEAALDRVPLHPASEPLPKGKQSALAVLSEDNDKL
jgi:hypothetical protein